MLRFAFSICNEAPHTAPRTLEARAPAWRSTTVPPLSARTPAAVHSSRQERRRRAASTNLRCRSTRVSREIWRLAHHRPPWSSTDSDAPLLCACCCVGAPLVSSRLTSRVDKAGKPACEQCGRRLADCKGKLHKHGAGKICQGCYDERRYGSSAQAAVTAPTRSHKRAKAEPSKSDTAAAVAAAAAPLLSRTRRPHRVYAPKPLRSAAPPKQSKASREAEIAALLDATVARRAVLEEAERIATAALFSSDA